MSRVYNIVSIRQDAIFLYFSFLLAVANISVSRIHILMTKSQIKHTGPEHCNALSRVWFSESKEHEEHL